MLIRLVCVVLDLRSDFGRLGLTDLQNICVCKVHCIYSDLAQHKKGNPLMGVAITPRINKSITRLSIMSDRYDLAKME